MIPKPACTVRGCGLVLERLSDHFACPRGHAFDVARSGRVTLLQPQDKRSSEAGDSADAVTARARALAWGAADELARAVVALVDAHAPSGPLDVLDVGCGDGFVLAALAKHRPIEACGVDLSTRAADLAAKRLPEALVVVANADRGLPWPDASFDVALSITSRRPVAEVHRVLKPGGLLVVAIPAEDDLVELRESVLGRGERRDRVAALREELGPRFAEREHRVARARLELSAEQQRDLLASTYRGARSSQADRLAALRPASITLAQDVVALARVGEG